MSAIHQSWLVGDILLAKGLSVLQELKNEAKEESQVPHLYKEYDVFSFFPAIGDRLHKMGGNPMLRLMNAFTEAINKFDKLPRFIVILFDQELIKHADSKADMIVIISSLNKESNKMIDSCKAKLLSKAKSKENPTLVYIKMLPKQLELDPYGKFKNKK